VGQAGRSQESAARDLLAAMRTRLAELLKQLQVNVPVRLGGKVSLDVSAQIPVTAANSLRAYKVKGKLSSPELQIEDLRVRQAAAVALGQIDQ
jgi:hypothetical protein